jgi:hypothetical protein
MDLDEASLHRPHLPYPLPLFETLIPVKVTWIKSLSKNRASNTADTLAKAEVAKLETDKRQGKELSR